MMARCLAVAIPLLLSACGPKANDSGATAVAEPADADPESGQGRALEAGRALIGTDAPVAVLRTVDGATIDLAKAYGRTPVYLKFWATWCVPCRQQMPGFEAEFERYRGRILTVAVNTGFNDTADAVREYRREHGLKMPIAIDDGSLGAALNLRVTPQHVVIGRDGRILYVGHLDDRRLADALRQAVVEQPSAQVLRAPGATVTGLDPLAKAAGFPVQGPYKRPRVLVFFSPWCEQYFEKSRPAYTQACRRVREEVNRLAQSGDEQWVGIASGLWSSTKDLTDYKEERGAYHLPLYLDGNGAAFRAFGVRDVPTVIILNRNGRIVRRLGPGDRGLSNALREASTPA